MLRPVIVDDGSPIYEVRLRIVIPLSCLSNEVGMKVKGVVCTNVD